MATVTLEESYAYCERISRERAKNFYYSFLLLPRPKRQAMCAIYAFMRECDDRSDGPGATLASVVQWRAELDAALGGSLFDDPVWPAFAATARRYRIPPRYFHEMMDGVASDFQTHSVATYEKLYRYCYLVASIVGLTIIHIFGFEDPKALELAEKCGVAFQLTNILRDIREDAGNGRIYLPEEDLIRFGVQPEELNQSRLTQQMRALLEFECARARKLYDESRPLLDMVHRDSRPALWALMEIYRRLLDRIETEGYPVLERRVGLPARDKIGIVVRAWLRFC